MASVSSAPLPSPAPTLPTPHAPGSFPDTPSPSVYHQSEGPLEAAGRELDAHPSGPSAGPAALFGAAAGLLVGGVGGALAGAGLFGTAKLENEALREKLHPGEYQTANQRGDMVEDRAKTPTPASSTTIPPGESSAEVTTAGEAVHRKEEAALAGVTGVAAGAAAVVAAKGLDQPQVNPYDEPVHNAMPHRTANDHDSQTAAGLIAPTDTRAPTGSPGIQTAAGVAFFEGDHLPDDVKAVLQKPSDDLTTNVAEPTTTQHYHQLDPVVHNTVFHHHYYVDPADVPADDSGVVHNPPTALEKGKGKEVAEVAGLSAGAEAINEYLEHREELAAQAGLANLDLNEHRTSTEALEAGLMTSPPLAGGESGSRFYEELDGVRRPGLTSHFSNATVATSAADTAPPTPAVAGRLDPFETQRVNVGQLHEVSKGPGHRITTSELEASKAIPVAAAGFAVAEGVQPQTQAQADFAHMSSPATAQPVEAVSPVDPEGAAAADKLKSEYVPLAAGAGLAGIGAGSVAYAESGADQSDQWSTRAIPPDSPAVTPGISNTPPMTPRGPKSAGLRENVLVGSLAPTANDTNSGVATPSSTRASRGSPPPLVGQQTFLDESRVQSDDGYSPSSPGRGSNTHSRQSSIDRSVHRSPHLKVATRADSIGHNRLVKKHVKVSADELARIQHHGSSPAGSPRLGSPAQLGSPARSISPVVVGTSAPASPAGRRRSGSAGADMWDHSVANVVNDETAHRHGHRPQLVSIASEDRRDSVLDRFAGVPDPTQRSRSPRSQAIPPVAGEHQGQVSNKLRRRSSLAREEKSGVFARMFGHKKTASNGGSEGGSPRGSVDLGRA